MFFLFYTYFSLAILSCSDDYMLLLHLIFDSYEKNNAKFSK
ncbi:hypothetical protein K710_0439 [Streptococcus iniae SF1]|nr:hypothetical protein K710_0439 [Streptococcus iniae SF1]ATX39219.1 hypothetical protein CTW00_01026 [Streptococcus iniae]